MPNLYILAGPNGAGKTTAAYTLLPEVLEIKNFVNADEIARGLSPFDVESVAMDAARIMLQRIDNLLDRSEDFAIETTLSTRSYVQLIRRAKQAGYVVSLCYIWVPSAEVSVARVAARVARGGHNIPVAVITRRYDRSIINLNKLYMPVCDYFIVISNADETPILVAFGGLDDKTAIFDETIWATITAYGNDKKANAK